MYKKSAIPKYIIARHIVGCFMNACLKLSCIKLITHLVPPHEGQIIPMCVLIVQTGILYIMLLLIKNNTSTPTNIKKS